MLQRMATPLWRQRQQRSVLLCVQRCGIGEIGRRTVDPRGRRRLPGKTCWLVRRTSKARSTRFLRRRRSSRKDCGGRENRRVNQVYRSWLSRRLG